MHVRPGGTSNEKPRGARGRSAVRALLFGLGLLAVGLVSDSAHAYAWMIRHGFAECGGCHIDPMGGETLTGMGRVTGQTLMASDFGGKEPSDAAMFLFGIAEPDSVRLGGSFRALNIYNFETNNPTTFPMQMDQYGAILAGKLVVAWSVGVSRADSRFEHSSKARLFGNIEDEGMIAVSRNHWLGYKFTEDLMVRAGRINLPFGLRTPDHTMWVRSETLTDRESDQQHGVSVAYSSGRFRGELMASLGNFQVSGDQFRERGYSGFLEYSLAPRLAVGISSMLLTPRRELEVDQRAVRRQAHGITGRYSPFQKLVLLTEMNVVRKTGAGFGYVGMATADYEPLRGMHLALTGEAVNRGTAADEIDGEGPGRGENRFGVWSTINWFLLPHVDLRVDLVLRQRRAAMLQSQIHIFL